MMKSWDWNRKTGRTGDGYESGYYIFGALRFFDF